MDWQRTLIIAALAVVSYLMILQWQEDYGSNPQEISETASTQSYPQEATGNTDLPAVENTNMASADDVPQVQDETTTAPAPSTQAPSNDLIEVVTDVSVLKINPVGGDIVEVALKDYPVSVERPDSPITLLRQSDAHTYIAQSGLIGPNGPDSSASGRPLYRSEQTRYEMKGDTLTVPLTYSQADGSQITKTYTFTKGNYAVDVKMAVTNAGTAPWQGVFYGQIKRDGSPDPGMDNSMSFGLPTFLGGAYWTPEKRYNKVKLGDMAEQPLKQSIPGGWLAMIQHYFMSAWIPDQNQTHLYTTRVVNGHYIIGFTSPRISVEPGQSHTFDATFYAGPKIQQRLEELLPDKGLDLAVDYGPLFFISKMLYKALDMFHGLTGNWGIAIILLTVLVKLIFFYPSAISYRSMAKMRKVAPELTRLREQYGEDRQKLSMEMMNLYKKEKINPLSGCLPILIQMPVFLALYWALLESVELRQASFLWINDLSMLDPIFVLPLLMGGSMYIQQLLNPAPPDPMQAKVMRFLPVIFTVMFLWFPAGLVLYWVTNNVLSILQQWVITRRIEAGAD